MPDYHPNEHPGLLQAETPDDLGERASLLAQKHINYIIDFSNVRLGEAIAQFAQFALFAGSEDCIPSCKEHDLTRS